MRKPNGTVIFCGVLIALSAVLAYRNSFTVPFLFDDVDSIAGNPTIQPSQPLTAALSPPGGGKSVAGRPFLNLTLAVNQKWSGSEVWSYHALNLTIHILAGLTLFGIVRRTWPLHRPFRGSALAGPASSLTPVSQTEGLLPAFAIALLWTLHPLQTESVTYVVQRAESLMGLFYLLTLYGFIRGVEHRAKASITWFVLSIAACLSGMATKEVMASAPLMVILYDRTFLSGTFREAWRRHWPVHTGLLATWLLLAWLIIGTGGNRGGSIGFGVGVSWWAHALTQFPAITRYLWLSVWPHPLVFEYGIEWVSDLRAVAPCALLVGGLLTVTVIGLWRRSFLGFAGAWFFAILAPTSLMPAASQMTVEHRMYLPLAAVAVALVAGWHALLGRRSLIGLLVLASALGCLTARRNHDYQSTLAIWSDTVAKRPGNALAHSSLAGALATAGRRAEAVGHYEESLKIQPIQPEAHNNLGSLLVKLGHPAEAAAHLAEALHTKPEYTAAHINLGNALLDLNRASEAVAEFETALRLEPDHPTAHYDLGNAFAATGRLPEAIAHYQAALRSNPANAELRDNLGNALAQSGKPAEAIPHYEASLQLDPGSAETHNNLGNALLLSGRALEAVRQYEAALQIKPDYVEARQHLALALEQAGQTTRQR